MSQNRGLLEVLSRDFFVVTVMMLFTGMCSEMLTPVMSPFSMELGADLSMAGLAGTVLGVSGMLFRPVAGMLADTIGRKKVALAGTLLYALAYAGYVFVQSFPQLLVLRAVQGIASCTSSTAFSTIITDVVPHEHVTEGLALSNVAGAVTMSLGPAMGLWISGFFGERRLFLFGVLMAVIALLFFPALRYREPVRERSSGARSFSPGSLLEQSALLPMFMYFLLMIDMALLNVFLPQYITARQGGDSSVFFLVLAVGVIFTRLRIGALVERLGERTIAIASTLIFFGCTVVFAFDISTLTLTLSGLVFGFGYGASIAVFNGAALRYCRPEKRGAANATFMMGLDIGFAVGSFAWGVVIKQLDYPATFLLAGVLTLAVIPLYLLSERRQPA